MTVVHSFAPLESVDAHTLILGSMPGVASLQAGRYYAHPRNAFWPIMTELFALDPSATYDERVTALTDHRVAVWDVLKLCTRAGSSDSAIVQDTVVVNDFGEFFDAHPRIDRVFFNGAAAERLYLRHVGTRSGVEFTRLPSTSPAHASVSPSAKARAWSVVTGVAS